jgi:hypothetical protein
LGEGSWGFGMIWAMASIHVAGSNERLLLLRSARLKLSARETDWLPLMAVLDGAGLSALEGVRTENCDFWDSLTP